VKTKRRALAERSAIMGHTQETLAEFTGVDRTTVGRWERGETFPQAWCQPKLADALKVLPEELDRMLTEGKPVEDPERDPVLSAPWSHRGTVEVANLLRGGDRVKRRGFVFLTGTTLTAPAHQLPPQWDYAPPYPNWGNERELLTTVSWMLVHVLQGLVLAGPYSRVRSIGRRSTRVCSARAANWSSSG
jgi:DNA-binding XRE family transcriptional regulator